jgi:hypothetical protein
VVDPLELDQVRNRRMHGYAILAQWRDGLCG